MAKIKCKLSLILFVLFVLSGNGKFILANIADTSISVAPSSPSDLSATVISYEQIDLSWSLVSGATSYNVYRSGTLIISVDTNFYSVTGLDAGASYSFTVSSVNIFGESSQSSPVLATTLERIQVPTGGGGGGGTFENLVVPARKKGLTPPSGGFKILINGGAGKTGNLSVIIQLDGGLDVTQVKISNNPDFKGVVSEKYAKTKTWVLSGKDGEKTVYVKFLNNEGESSPILSDSIILDISPPQINITKIKDFYRADEEIILEGTVNEPAEIIFYWDKKYGLIETGDNRTWAVNLGKMSLGGHSVALMAKDDVDNSKTIMAEVLVRAQETPVEKPAKPSKPFSFLPFIFENIGEKIKSISRFISAKQKVPLKIVIVSQDTPQFLDGKWNLLPVKPLK